MQELIHGIACMPNVRPVREHGRPARGLHLPLLPELDLGSTTIPPSAEVRGLRKWPQLRAYSDFSRSTQSHVRCLAFFDDTLHVCHGERRLTFPSACLSNGQQTRSHWRIRHWQRLCPRFSTCVDARRPWQASMPSIETCRSASASRLEVLDSIPKATGSMDEARIGVSVGYHC